MGEGERKTRPVETHSLPVSDLIASLMTREDATAPRTLPWPKGSDTISKNGTLSSVTSSPALRPPHGSSRLGASTPTRSHGWVSPSALSRKGAVPVMVPAQNQAGSLV